MQLRTQYARCPVGLAQACCLLSRLLGNSPPLAPVFSCCKRVSECGKGERAGAAFREQFQLAATASAQTF
jgi:hypothetical protein